MKATETYIVGRMIPTSNVPAFMCFHALSVSARGNVDRTSSLRLVADRPSVEMGVGFWNNVNDQDSRFSYCSIPRLDPVRIRSAAAEQDDENSNETHDRKPYHGRLKKCKD